MFAVVCDGKHAAVCRPASAVQRIFRAGNAAVCVAVVLDGRRYHAVRPLFHRKRNTGHIWRGRVDEHLCRGRLAGGVARSVHHTGGHRCFTSCCDGHGGVAHGTARPCAAVDAVLVVMDAAAVVARRCAPVRQACACVCAARKTHHRAVPLPTRGRADLHAGRLGEVIAVIAARVHRHVDRDVYPVIRQLPVVVPVPHQRVADAHVPACRRNIVSIARHIQIRGQRRSLRIPQRVTPAHRAEPDVIVVGRCEDLPCVDGLGAAGIHVPDHVSIWRAVSVRAQRAACGERRGRKQRHTQQQRKKTCAIPFPFLFHPSLFLLSACI